MAAQSKVEAGRKTGGKAKGSQKTGGRVKGTPNKLTTGLKDAILGAFHECGGQAYLQTVARDDPRTFCTLLGKVLPTTLQGDPDNPQVIQLVTGVDRN